MPIFEIKAEVVVTYIHSVEAETIEEAIMFVEDGDADDCVEHDSSVPFVQEYTIPGQMGWNILERGENDEPIIPKEKSDG